jgi:endonuclease/exonuclease/phosphatase family metal-dependent hydrolase
MKIRQKHLDLESLLDFKNIISSLKKYKNGLLEREKQVDYLHSKQKETSNKSIICIDLNDTPFSYAYHSMKSRYQDAYMQQGRFLGKTYNSGIPFLRIDYQFADPRLKVLQFEIMNDITLSDHYPIVVHYGL